MQPLLAYEIKARGSGLQKVRSGILGIIGNMFYFVNTSRFFYDNINYFFSFFIGISMRYGVESEVVSQKYRSRFLTPDNKSFLNEG